MSNQDEFREASTTFERIGGKIVLLSLAALSGGSGIVALLSGHLAERGSRSAPRQIFDWSGLPAYGGGVFLVAVGITFVVFAFKGLRARRMLKVLLAIDALAFVAAVATRFQL